MKLLITIASSLAMLSTVQAAWATDKANETDQQDIHDTIIRYKAAVEANGQNPKNQLKLGKAYLMAGDLDNAVSTLDKTVKLTPEDPEAL